MSQFFPCYTASLVYRPVLSRRSLGEGGDASCLGKRADRSHTSFLKANSGNLRARFRLLVFEIDASLKSGPRSDTKIPLTANRVFQVIPLPARIDS
jgi:hypothetical protein